MIASVITEPSHLNQQQVFFTPVARHSAAAAERMNAQHELDSLKEGKDKHQSRVPLKARAILF